MALGDGIRRNVRTITAHERQRFTKALLALQGRTGHAASTDVTGPSADYWFTLDEIREGTQIHHGAEFLPWHRELCNRFEQMLRDVDPELSLHYW
ncbi:MAG: tyrosinase family protein, partial [Vicinamibacterales bacterium]